MKKIFITTLVIIFSFIQSFGQVHFGVKGGLNLSNVNGYRADSKTRAGFNAGLLLEYVASKKIIMRPELLYSIKGYRFPATTSSGAGTLSLNYISIPLLVGYRPIDKLTILLGPEFNIMTNANSKFGGSNHDESNYFKKVDLAIDLGAAWSIKNDLGVEIRYSYGMKDLTEVVYTDAFGAEIGRDLIGSNRVFQVGVFYKFAKK